MLWSSCTAIYWVGDILVRGIVAIISFSWTALWVSRYVLILALLILIFYGKFYKVKLGDRFVLLQRVQAIGAAFILFRILV